MRLLDRLALAGLLFISTLFGRGPGTCRAEPSAGEIECTCHVTRQGASNIVETTNFRVSGAISRETAVEIANRCERLRRELGSKWLPDQAPVTWESRCEVVVHANLARYVGAVGRAGAQTVGSADVSSQTSGELRRRIDLRGDLLDRSLAALPHEMTHVVLADAFGDWRPPLWADEGMAILSDPLDKRRGHAADVRRAVATGRQFEPAELLSSDAYPADSRWGAYYGQSAAVVQFLVERKSAPDFLSFLAIADKRGYDAAVREIYGLRDVSALRGAWGPNLAVVSDRRK